MLLAPLFSLPDILWTLQGVLCFELSRGIYSMCFSFPCVKPLSPSFFFLLLDPVTIFVICFH